MKYVVCDQVVLSKAPEGPLAAYIGPFAEFVGAQGYSPSSVHRQVFLSSDFSRWLKQKRVALRSVRTKHTERYLRYRARKKQICRGDAAALTHLLDFLHSEDVIPQQFSIRIRTIVNMALDNLSLLLYKTLGTYNRISSVYELSLSTRIASPDL